MQPQKANNGGGTDAYPIEIQQSAFNENKLTSRKSAFEWVESLLEKHNQEAQHSCVMFYGEEELED